MRREDRRETRADRLLRYEATINPRTCSTLRRDPSISRASISPQRKYRGVDDVVFLSYEQSKIKSFSRVCRDQIRNKFLFLGLVRTEFRLSKISIHRRVNKIFNIKKVAKKSGKILEKENKFSYTNRRNDL